MTTLLDLPPDILRYLTGENLDYDDTLQFSQVSKSIHRIICSNDTVWHNLVSRFLTRHRTNSKPREILKEFYQLVTDKSIFAAKRGYEVYIQSQLEEGFLNHVFRDMIEYSTWEGHLEIYRMLVDPIEGYNHSQNLGRAVVSKNLEMVRYITEQSCDNSNFPIEVQSAFVQTFYTSCNFEIADYLLTQGAILDLPGRYGRTAIQAAVCCSVDSVRFLVKRGAKVSDDTLKFVLSDMLANSDTDRIIRYLIKELKCKLSDRLLDVIPVQGIDYD